jgi:hypothetical protein
MRRHDRLEEDRDDADQGGLRVTGSGQLLAAGRAQWSSDDKLPYAVTWTYGQVWPQNPGNAVVIDNRDRTT